MKVAALRRRTLLAATAAAAATASAQTMPMQAPDPALVSGEACPQVHVFGARETTAPPGFGSAGTLVDLVLRAFPDATSEAIDYPAAGGDDYASSVSDGIIAVVGQLQLFAKLCPDAVIIMHGYSQVRRGLSLRLSLAAQDGWVTCDCG
jgi:acetylxylan esterase